MQPNLPTNRLRAAHFLSCFGPVRGGNLFSFWGGLLLTLLVLATAGPAFSQTVDLLTGGGGPVVSSDDAGLATATDASGNVYVTGYFLSNATISGSAVASAGGTDIFVAKYNSSGTLQWIKRAGGTGDDAGLSIAVSTTAVYVTGYIASTANFNTPSNPASNTLVADGFRDIFVAKYDLNGNVLRLQRAGGTGSDEGAGITADASENVYVTGYISSTANFNTPSNPATNTLVSAGGNGFVVKYDAAGGVAWLKRAGGRGYGIALDGNGVYITGTFSGTVNFNTPSAPGSNELIASSNFSDMFVAGYDLSGSPLWQQRAGGGSTNSTYGYGIATRSGFVYVTGSFGGTTEFSSSLSLTASSGNDIFVANYDAATGGSLVWVKQVKSVGSDAGQGIVADASGNVYVTGYFTGTADFNPTAPGTNTLTASGTYDIFVAKYSSSGAIQWQKRAGASGATSSVSDIGYGIAVSGTQVYVAGSFQGTANFNTPSATGSNEITSVGGTDIFLANFNGSTGATGWLQSGGGAGSSGNDAGLATATDASGNVYVTGYFTGDAVISGSAVTSAGGEDIFVVKYNSAGVLQWLKRAGGTGVDWGKGIAVSGSEVYVTGFFSSTANFETPSNPASSSLLVSAGVQDIFVAKYDAATGNLVWLKRAGGTIIDRGEAIAVNGTDIYVTGQFQSTANFETPSNPASNTLISDGSTDIFVAKFNNSGALQWLRRAGGTAGDAGFGIAATATDVYVTGAFSNTANFNTPSAPATNTLVSAGGQDIFVAKYDAATGAPQWQNRAGGTGTDGSNGIGVNAMGVYVAGYFRNTADFNSPTSNPATNTLVASGVADIFLAQYSPTGTVNWLRRAGGTGFDIGQGLAVDASGSYVTGQFAGVVDFNTPTSIASNTLIGAGGQDVFVAKYDNAGTPMWQRRAGGTGNETGSGIAVNTDGVYVTGEFQNTADFNTPTSTASNTLVSTGAIDYFLARFTNPLPLSLTVAATPVTSGTATASVTAVNGTGPYSYTWTAPTGIVLTPVGNGSSVQVSTTACVTGQQTLTVLATDTGASPPVTTSATVSLTFVGVSVTVTATPSLTIAPGGSVTLTASGGSGQPATSYTWSDGTQSTSVVLSGVTSATTLSVTGVSGLCSNTARAVVSVTAMLSLTVGATPVTNGSATASVTATNGTGPYSYTWVAPSDITLTPGTNSSSVQAAANVCISGVRTLTVIVEDGAAPPVRTTATVNLTFAGVSVSITATPSLTIAPGGSVTLTASGATSYTWSDNSTANPLILTGVTSATTLSVTGVSGLCSNTASAAVVVVAAVVAPTLSASGSLVCEGGMVSVVGTTNSPVTSYQWYKDGASLGTAQRTATLSLGGVLTTQSGNYSLVVSDGVTSATTSAFSLTVIPQPTVTLLFGGATQSMIGPGMPLITLTRPIDPNNLPSFQVFGGMMFERRNVIDRVSGYEIRQVDTNTTGVFNIQRVGQYTITVTGANGCQRTVQGTIESR
ncbi:MAG: hypothetical protein EAZ91_22100 [Cytophagales bacterium]|nr:MAG: hypothetical protein EAZ91_22100 [Cytophagales bacterium]